MCGAPHQDLAQRNIETSPSDPSRPFHKSTPRLFSNTAAKSPLRSTFNMVERYRVVPALLLSGAAVGSAFVTNHRQTQTVHPASRLGVGTIPDLSSATAPTDEADIFGGPDDETPSDASSSAASPSSWQENIERLLKPDTNIAERQVRSLILRILRLLSRDKSNSLLPRSFFRTW